MCIIILHPTYFHIAVVPISKELINALLAILAYSNRQPVGGSCESHYTYMKGAGFFCIIAS